MGEVGTDPVQEPLPGGLGMSGITVALSGHDGQFWSVPGGSETRALSAQPVWQGTQKPLQQQRKGLEVLLLGAVGRPGSAGVSGLGASHLGLCPGMMAAQVTGVAPTP